MFNQEKPIVDVMIKVLADEGLIDNDEYEIDDVGRFRTVILRAFRAGEKAQRKTKKKRASSST